MTKSGTKDVDGTTDTEQRTGITLDEFYSLKCNGDDVSHIRADDIITESGLPVSPAALEPIPKNCHGIRRN